MKKQSAGLLLYKIKGSQVEILLVHSGGPFWAKKDQGAWSVPKGEYMGNEDPLNAAKREYEEEIGQPPPSGEYIELGEIKRKDGKVIRAWAVEGDIDAGNTRSNTFEMEWPPRSGKKQKFPEVDRAAWTTIDVASVKMHQGQQIFLERLAKYLKIRFNLDEKIE